MKNPFGHPSYETFQVQSFEFFQMFALLFLNDIWNGLDINIFWFFSTSNFVFSNTFPLTRILVVHIINNQTFVFNIQTVTEMQIVYFWSLKILKTNIRLKLEMVYVTWDSLGVISHPSSIIFQFKYVISSIIMVLD